RTGVPDSKATSATMPGRSALTVTPCAGATVPIVFSVAGHTSCRATRVVTASGGGWNDAAWAAAPWIWWNFTEPMATTKAAIPATITIIRLVSDDILITWNLRARPGWAPAWRRRHRGLQGS